MFFVEMSVEILVIFELDIFSCFIVEVLRHVLDLYLLLDTWVANVFPAVRIVFYILAISLDAIPL